MLSLNASSPPFKVVLTLPNLCVVPRDSRDAKADMQPESLKSFVAYSTTSTATPARERERNEQLAQGKAFNPSIRSFVRLSPTVYTDAQNLKFDPFLLSGICSQVLSPQAFQILPAATCSPAVNACFGGFLCSRIVSRYIAFCLCHFPLANQFLQHPILELLGPLAPGT